MSLTSCRNPPNWSRHRLLITNAVRELNLWNMNIFFFRTWNENHAGYLRSHGVINNMRRMRGALSPEKMSWKFFLSLPLFKSNYNVRKIENFDNFLKEGGRARYHFQIGLQVRRGGGRNALYDTTWRGVFCVWRQNGRRLDLVCTSHLHRIAVSHRNFNFSLTFL